MSQRKINLFLTAAVLCLSSAAHAENNDPGSLLLFPEVDNRPGRSTIMTVTNTERGFQSEAIRVHFNYIEADDCSKADALEVLTPGDTVTVISAAHAPSHERGYCYAYALGTTGGPIDDAEGRDYAERALAVLRDLAVSQNAVMSVADATTPMVASLDEYNGPIRMKIADLLSRIGQQRAQVALMNAALNSSGTEQVDLLGMVSDSAKRYGNMLTDRQVRRLVDLARTGDQAQGTAAAALMGAPMGSSQVSGVATSPWTVTGRRVTGWPSWMARATWLRVMTLLTTVPTWMGIPPSGTMRPVTASTSTCSSPAG